MDVIIAASCDSTALCTAFTQTPNPKIGNKPPNDTFTAPREVTTKVFESAKALVRGSIPGVLDSLKPILEKMPRVNKYTTHSLCRSMVHGPCR